MFNIVSQHPGTVVLEGENEDTRFNIASNASRYTPGFRTVRNVFLNRKSVIKMVPLMGKNSGTWHMQLNYEGSSLTELLPRKSPFCCPFGGRKRTFTGGRR